MEEDLEETCVPAGAVATIKCETSVEESLIQWLKVSTEHDIFTKVAFVVLISKIIYPSKEAPFLHYFKRALL